MINFPFYNPIKKTLSDYIKLSNDISMNKMKERYKNHSLKNDCILKNFSSNYENDCRDDDNNDDNNHDKNFLVENKILKVFVLSFIGTGCIFSLSFVFYKIYILYII
jgi:hypothetical protein